MKKNIRVHIVSHTHWDREWYMSFQQFRMRLVKLMEELFDIFEKETDYSHFNLDGQTICIEDYLEIRPEKSRLLKQLIEDGKIAIGPWYVLPDGFLTGSEAFIKEANARLTDAEVLHDSLENYADEVAANVRGIDTVQIFFMLSLM